jgi:hypothetical protein
MKDMKSIIVVCSMIFLILGCGEDRSQNSGNGISPSGGSIKLIHKTSRGKVMSENNFVYVPGGFDVDNDGINEAGFWLAAYEAKEDSNRSSRVISSSRDSISGVISNSFQLLSSVNSPNRKFDSYLNNNNNYLNASIGSLRGFETKSVKFVSTGDSLSSISPLEAVVSLQNSQINNGYAIQLPTEKQWMQVVKLVINNPKNWTGEKVGIGKLYQGDKSRFSNRNSFFIKNGILGDDPLVKDDYEDVLYDLSGGVSEWTSGMIAIEDRFITGDSGEHEFSEISRAPDWWKPAIEGKTTVLGSQEGAGAYHDGASLDGANDTLAITGATGDVSSYAVVARGGSNSDDDANLVGIGAAKLRYGAGHKGPTIGFRAASEYMY